MVPCIKKTTLAAAVAFLAASAAQAADLDRLRALLDATPAGGWVQANTGSFSSAFPTGSDAVNIQSYSDPGLIVGAWSSFAWNTDTASLMLWGGGHANYAGNEMYIWNAASGAWSRGSLPSKLSSSWFISDNSAPQSAHTYDNQLYLPVNKMFLTLGGAAFPSGGNFQAEVGGAVVRTGPWMFDPSRADPSKVGGSSGSGFDPATPGGNMWINRGTSYGGTLPQSFVEGSTAYRGEGEGTSSMSRRMPGSQGGHFSIVIRSGTCARAKRTHGNWWVETPTPVRHSRVLLPSIRATTCSCAPRVEAGGTI